MDGEHKYITAAQAAQLFLALDTKKFIMIGGEVIAGHQIKSIKPLSKEEAQVKLGIGPLDYSSLPTIHEAIKTLQPTQKLLPYINEKM